MQAILLALSSTFIAQAAFAGTPVPMVGGSCPYHTQQSGGACVPVGDHQVFIKGSGGCPVTWTESTYYCVK